MVARKLQEAKSEASVQAVLDAGLELFSTQGYRATTLRQIADAAGLSVGNIYHHFPSKHEIYLQLIARYWQRLLDPELPLNKIFAAAEFPEDLERMAAAIESIVDDNSAHILLIYVDVIEFGGANIKPFYEGMAKRFEVGYGARFRQRIAAGDFGDGDPMTAVMMTTRWLFYFFTVEKCFGAPLHFGMTPKQAVDGFIRLIRHGLLPRATGVPTPAGTNNLKPSRTATRSRTQRGGKS